MRNMEYEIISRDGVILYGNPSFRKFMKAIINSQSVHTGLYKIRVTSEKYRGEPITLFLLKNGEIILEAE